MRDSIKLLFMLLGMAYSKEFVVSRLSGSLLEDKVSSRRNEREAGKPQVTQLHVESSIKYRYAHTRVQSRISNPANSSQEVFFTLLLPETAFITSFVMELEGKQYKAFLREKDAAKKEYDAAVSSGVAAAHVQVSARNANRFTISVNVEAGSKALFVLSYEELLSRTLGLYSHVINLTPAQVVRDLLVDVFIAEPTDIIELHVPKIKSSNEVMSGAEGVNDLVEIHRPSPKKAHIRYKPSITDQERSIGGQLIVRYDVERTTQPGGQILVNDGFFVHFFAPEGLPPLRKLAIFVLDLSGSMEGRKVEQLKTAMHTILDDLGERDHFNIVDFSYSVTVHSLDTPAGSVVLPPDTSIAKTAEIPPPYPKTPEYIKKAKQVVNKMSSGGGTNIYDALKNAIIVAQSGVEKIKKEEGESEKDTLEPIIIFLTDGDPTVGITKHSRILNMVKEFNNPRCSIFSLGFGNGADMRFLRKLSLSNAGFARSIYEASDAALQLSNFYKEVASPLLSNVTFSYVPGQVVPGSVTKDSFSSLFLGSELVVAGRLSSNVDNIESKVEGTTVNGTTSFQAKPLRNIPDDISTIEYLDESKTTEELEEEVKGENRNKLKKKKKKLLMSNLERVWAYLTIQQYVDKLEAAEGNQQLEKEIRKEAVSLALKYKFVTPFTSLVVVKPNKTEEISNGKPQTQDMVFKNKVAYLQGALYGVPAQFAPSRIDYMTSQPSSPSTIDRFDNEEMSEEVYQSSTEYEYGMTESGSRLYLEDIAWLPEVFSWENSTVSLPRGRDNASETYLFMNATSEDYHGTNCTLTDNIEGVCRHVVDCILPQFAFSLPEYMFNYFCLISGGDLSEEEGERFHQDIKTLEERYQGRWDSNMMADYCWSIVYAGACCPEVVDTSLPYLYSSTELSSESSEAWTEPPTTTFPPTD